MFVGKSILKGTLIGEDLRTLRDNRMYSLVLETALKEFLQYTKSFGYLSETLI